MYAITAGAQSIESVLHVVDSLNPRTEKALEALNLAIVDFPGSEELLRVRADAYEYFMQYDKAIDDYKRMIKLDPGDENLWYLLARNQYMNGQLQEALTSLNRSTRLNSKFLPAYHVKIQILLQQNNIDLALKVSDSTLNIGETATSFFLQGEVYSKMKSWQKAEWAYQSATKIDKGYIEAYIALANIFAVTNKSVETIEAAESALEIDPDSKDAFIARSKGFALLKDYENAIEDVAFVISLDPNNANAHYLRGTYYKDNNKPGEAIKDFDFVLKIQPNHWNAIAGRAESYAKTGNKTAALAGFQKLLSIAENFLEKDAIIQYANLQIFELNRENRAPVMSLSEPASQNFEILLPDNIKNVNIKGIIEDESPIKYLTVNGKTTPVINAGNDNEFVCILEIANMKEIQIEASDVYDNVAKLAYKIVLHETNKPEISLFTPRPSETGVITLTSNETNLYVEGRVTDESVINAIEVDNKPVSFDRDNINPAFSAIVDISNKNSFTIKATDRYGNVTEQKYEIERITE